MFHSPPQPMWDLTIHSPSEPRVSLALEPLSNQCGISQFTPLWGPTSLLIYRPVSSPLRGSMSSLAHCPVSSSNNICDSPSPSPPPADIILFGLFSRFLKCVCQGEVFKTLIKNVSFSSPTNVGSHILQKNNNIMTGLEINLIRCWRQVEKNMCPPIKPGTG